MEQLGAKARKSGTGTEPVPIQMFVERNGTGKNFVKKGGTSYKKNLWSYCFT